MKNVKKYKSLAVANYNTTMWLRQLTGIRY